MNNKFKLLSKYDEIKKKTIKQISKLNQGQIH